MVIKKEPSRKWLRKSLKLILESKSKIQNEKTQCIETYMPFLFIFIHIFFAGIISVHINNQVLMIPLITW